MRIKSYFAETVEAAISLAARELGPDTMLVNAQKAPPEARHLGEYEVVFALADEVPAEPAPAEHKEAASWERLLREVGDLRRQVERTAALVARTGPMVSGRWQLRQDLARLFSLLTDNEIPPELAGEIVDKLESSDQPDRDVKGELRARFEVDSRIQPVTAFVGPPGAGKTTALVKVAARSALRALRPVQILSVDNHRIAAAEQLRCCAAILGAGFELLETTRALESALARHASRDLVLIDTPGLGARDMDGGWDLARFLASRSDIDTHLVLSAAMKAADLRTVVDRYELFRPAKLLFTHLDETATCGTLLGEAARTGKPISFLSCGQQIPEDLEPATKPRLVSMVTGEATPAVERAAAA